MKKTIWLIVAITITLFFTDLYDSTKNYLFQPTNEERIISCVNQQINLSTSKNIAEIQTYCIRKINKIEIAKQSIQNKEYLKFEALKLIKNNEMQKAEEMLNAYVLKNPDFDKTALNLELVKLLSLKKSELIATLSEQKKIYKNKLDECLSIIENQ